VARKLFGSHGLLKDAAIKNWPAIFYIAINFAASVGALGLIHAYGWFGQSRGGFLQIFLTAADRAVDRKRAGVRSDAVLM